MKGCYGRPYIFSFTKISNACYDHFKWFSCADFSLFLKLKLELGFPSPFDFTIEITQLKSLCYVDILRLCDVSLEYGLKWLHWKQSKSLHKRNRRKLLWLII